MIRRLLARIADRLTDSGWLRAMRYREVQATRSAMHLERRERHESRDFANTLGASSPRLGKRKDHP